MKLFKEAILTLLLALLWFGTAYYAAEALVPGWGIRCGLVSLIIGLITLAIVNRTEAGSRLLYEGKSDSEEIGCAKVVVWFLIALPFTLFILGTLWWLMRLLGLFDFE